MRGVKLETPDGVVQARPEAVEHLEEPVALLLVAVKAPALADALERIEVFAVADGVALPLLNGLEHPDVVRRRLGPRVAPASISRFQAYAVEERERNAVRDREDLDSLQRIGERRRLDCDQQQRDGFLQVLDHLRSCLHDAVGCLELYPPHANCSGCGGCRDANDALP